MERKRVSISIDLFSRVSGISNQVIKKERERETQREMGKFANLNKQDEFVFVHIGNTLFPLKIFKNNFQEKEIREIKLHRF